MATAVSLNGTNQVETQTYSVGGTLGTIWTYNKTFTVTSQDVNYGISAKLGAYKHSEGGGTRTAKCIYFESGTTGTWTATGIAP